MTASDRIRAILLAKGYMPNTLAADLGVSWKVAKRILHGTSSFTWGDVAMLSDRLGVSPNFFCMTPGSLPNTNAGTAV